MQIIFRNFPVIIILIFCFTAISYGNTFTTYLQSQEDQLVTGLWDGFYLMHPRQDLVTKGYYRAWPGH